jgi:Trypsin
MPGYENPREATVSIWEQVADSDRFLGSGAFISPRFVLTAKHVVENKVSKSIRLGLVAGHERVPVHTMHCHAQFDIALLDLEREFPEQGLVRLDWVTSAFEDKTVDLYGINPDSHNRDGCKGYTIGNWLSQKGDYLFDHAQRKGFSGGIAVVKGRAVGILTQRHMSEQQGVMTPLYRVREWLQAFLTPSLLLPYPAEVRMQAEQSQNECTRYVRQEIGQLLKKKKLRPLHDLLVKGSEQAEPSSQPENVLLPLDGVFSLESSINKLRDATQECLEQLTDQGSNETADIADEVARVLGWLVLLAVSETWVQNLAGRRESGEHFQLASSAAYIALPVETETGAEVVEARLSRRQAAFALSRGDVEVMSLNRVRLGDLEVGLHADDALTEVKKLIWNAVFKKSHESGVLSPTDEKNLQYTLATRYKLNKHKESFYLLVRPGRDGEVAGHATLLKLRRDLPYLGVFLIGSATGEQVLVMDDVHLMVLIRDFLRMLKDYL